MLIGFVFAKERKATLLHSNRLIPFWQGMLPGKKGGQVYEVLKKNKEISVLIGQLRVVFRPVKGAHAAILIGSFWVAAMMSLRVAAPVGRSSVFIYPIKMDGASSHDIF